MIYIYTYDICWTYAMSCLFLFYSYHLTFVQETQVPSSSWEDVAGHLSRARDCRDDLLAMDVTKDDMSS